MNSYPNHINFNQFHTLLAALRKVVAEAQLTWSDDYDGEDLGDAVDHYNYISNLNFGKGVDINSVENTGTELFDPKDILSTKIKNKKPVGWLKEFPRSSWVAEFKNVYGRDLTHILEVEDINLPIMIEDTLCDGYARVTLAYALDEKVPIAIFEGISEETD
jgi:hypothetical protein